MCKKGRFLFIPDCTLNKNRHLIRYLIIDPSVPGSRRKPFPQAGDPSLLLFIDAHAFSGFPDVRSAQNGFQIGICGSSRSQAELFHKNIQYVG